MQPLPVTEQNATNPINISITPFSPVITGEVPDDIFSYTSPVPGTITYDSATDYFYYTTPCEPELTYSWNMGDSSPLLTGAFVNYTHASGTYTVEVTITGGPQGPLVRTCEVTIP